MPIPPFRIDRKRDGTPAAFQVITIIGRLRLTLRSGAAHRMTRTSLSEGLSGVLDLGLMVHSSGGYDEPKTLHYSSR